MGPPHLPNHDPGTVPAAFAVVGFCSDRSKEIFAWVSLAWALALFPLVWRLAWWDTRKSSSTTKWALLLLAVAVSALGAFFEWKTGFCGEKPKRLEIVVIVCNFAIKWTWPIGMAWWKWRVQRQKEDDVELGELAADSPSLRPPPHQQSSDAVSTTLASPPLGLVRLRVPSHTD